MSFMPHFLEHRKSPSEIQQDKRRKEFQEYVYNHAKAKLLPGNYPSRSIPGAILQPNPEVTGNPNKETMMLNDAQQDERRRKQMEYRDQLQRQMQERREREAVDRAARTGRSQVETSPSKFDSQYQQQQQQQQQQQHYQHPIPSQTPQAFVVPQSLPVVNEPNHVAPQYFEGVTSNVSSFESDKSIANIGDDAAARKRAKKEEMRAALEQQIREKRERMQIERAELRNQLVQPASTSNQSQHNESLLSSPAPRNSETSASQNISSQNLMINPMMNPNAIQPEMSSNYQQFPSSSHQPILPFTPFNPFALGAAPYMGYGGAFPMGAMPGYPTTVPAMGPSFPGGFRAQYALATEGMSMLPPTPSYPGLLLSPNMMASPLYYPEVQNDSHHAHASAQSIPAQTPMNIHAQPQQNASRFENEPTTYEAQSSSFHEGFGADTSNKRSNAAARYRQELLQQMNESKNKKEKEDELKRREDVESAEMLSNYNPWGKSGAGAPFRDAHGRIITNPKLLIGKREQDVTTNQYESQQQPMQKPQQQNYEDPSSSQQQNQDNNRGAGPRRGSIGSGNLFRDEREEKRARHAERQEELRRQIEEQKRAKDEARRLKLEEEREEELRLARERERLNERFAKEKEQELLQAQEKEAAKSGGKKKSPAGPNTGSASSSIAQAGETANEPTPSSLPNGGSSGPSTFEMEPPPPGMGESAKRKWMRMQAAKAQREMDAATGYVRPEIVSQDLDDRPVGKSGPRPPPQPRSAEPPIQPTQPAVSALHQQHLPEGEMQLHDHVNASYPNHSIQQDGMFRSPVIDAGYGSYNQVNPRPASGRNRSSHSQQGSRPSSALQSAGLSMMSNQHSQYDNSNMRQMSLLHDDLALQRQELRRRLQRVAEPESFKYDMHKYDQADSRSYPRYGNEFPGYINERPSSRQDPVGSFPRSEFRMAPAVNQPHFSTPYLEQDSAFVKVSANEDRGLDEIFDRGGDAVSATPGHILNVEAKSNDVPFLPDTKRLPSGGSEYIFPGKTPREFAPNRSRDASANSDQAVLDKFLKRKQEN